MILLTELAQKVSMKVVNFIIKSIAYVTLEISILFAGPEGKIQWKVCQKIHSSIIEWCESINLFCNIRLKYHIDCNLTVSTL